ncbi:MAG TPA: NHLP bacteriocin export ABC transporter permease/ATPase subunit [Candidatus Baltobacteraceae bacterium]|nr:NHLP bacteriocin export ABC transporter permease/ATPase subunit [Candidatus Baltobacteraceae bacterium]
MHTEETPLRIVGDEILILATTEHTYRVRSGEAALFVVQLDESGNPAGRRAFLGGSQPGDVLIGTSFTSNGKTFTLIAVGVVPTLVERWDLSETEPTHRDEALHRYLATLVGSDSVDLDSRLTRPLAQPQPLQLEPGQHAHSPRRLTYVRITRGMARLLDTHECDAETGIVPVSGHVTLRAHDVVDIEPVSGSDVHVHQVLRGITTIHAAFWKRWQEQAAEEDERRERMRRATQAFDARALRGTLEEATHLFERHVIAKEPGDDPIVAAARIVAQADGIQIVAPREPHADPQAAVQSICIESHLSFRRVRLRTGWHKREHGPLLAFRGANREPVALLPHHGRKHYTLVDPAHEGEPVNVDAALAAEIDSSAYVFLRPLPERPIRAWDLLRFGVRHSGVDGLQLLALGLTGGILASTIPLASAILYGSIIPGAMRPQLLTMGFALLVVALSAATTEIVRGLMVVRLQARVGSNVQTGVMERLLALPASFFRRYETGDLVDRLMGIDRIEQYVSDVTISAALSGVFSLVSFVLLFVYDVGLALVCGVLAAIAVAAAVLQAVVTVPLRQQVYDRTGSIAGFVLQVFNGVAKLRVARAETRAFVGWLHRFTAMRRIITRWGTVEYRFLMFGQIWPAAAILTIIWYIFVFRHGDFAASTFIAALAAFTQLLTALLGLSEAFVDMAGVVPIYARARPLLQELPEILEAHGDPGTLSGAIELRDLSFRYENAPGRTLDRLDLKIEPGAFVAIVGPSGSGKSTLFRLLLGFEKPNHGSVLYDSHDLNSVDLAAVRRQIGSVLQSTGALQGTIFENIAGARYITHDQAWEALRRVGIADDIKQLPMQLETYLGSDGGGLSTGQRQRIAIARAIATSPRILLLDEATSALDNETQAIVMKTLERLDATRVVIAHRLSTIQNADRIVVIEGGRIVQDGRYEELAGTPGPFCDLARRQSM